MNIKDILSKTGFERKKREYVDEDLTGLNLLKIERKNEEFDKLKVLGEKEI